MIPSVLPQAGIVIVLHGKITASVEDHFAILISVSLKRIEACSVDVLLI